MGERQLYMNSDKLLVMRLAMVLVQLQEHFRMRLVKLLIEIIAALFFLLIFSLKLILSKQGYLCACLHVFPDLLIQFTSFRFNFFQLVCEFFPYRIIR